MEKLSNEATQADVINAVNALIEKLDQVHVRDRGPKSTRAMSRLDAWRCIHGDLKPMGHKEAAEVLGLSYGQIYSARGTYTFKDVKKDEYQQADIVKLVHASESTLAPGASTAES